LVYFSPQYRVKSLLGGEDADSGESESSLIIQVKEEKMIKIFLHSLANSYSSWNPSSLVRRWRKNQQNHDNKVSEGVVRAMETLENALVREVDDVINQIRQLDNLEESLKGKQGTPGWVLLEKSYQDDSWSAAASDSKTHIRCIIDRIEELTQARRFYQLAEAINDAISHIERHQENFPGELLGDKVFAVLRESLNTARDSLKTLKDALENLTSVEINEHTDKQQLKKWAEHLERLGEELEDNLEFFPAKVFDHLEILCETIVLNARKKATNRKGRNQNKREEWRRRVRYAAGFILNLIEIAREDAIEEDEEVIQDFLAASQSSFEAVWEDEDEHWNTI
jgi:hypothetical protein